MTKKPSPTKTRTGNALAQFVILSALTVVAYQFIVTRLNTTAPPPPLTAGLDAALEKHRAKQRVAAGREAISTTEFSCFMACVGLFGLMQRKKKRSEEEAAEAQRRAVEKRILRRRDGMGTIANSGSDRDEAEPVVTAQLQHQYQCTFVDTLALLPSDVHVELLGFLTAEELVECAMVNKAWHSVAGDLSEPLWRTVFLRDFGETGERFTGLVPRVCWRQYYFLHRLSRAVELARWLDMMHQRKCVVIQGHVYDVTHFLDAHPGGYHVIGDVLGTDATELWDQFQHSTEAKELMEQFAIQDPVLDRTSRSDDQDLTATVSTQRNLAIVEKRWQQISWWLSHAHLFGPLSPTFLDLGFKIVVWRTTKSAPRSQSG